MSAAPNPARARAAEIARDRAAAAAAREALRRGLACAAEAACGAGAQAMLDTAARHLQAAPGTVAVHALQDALVAVRLVHAALPGLPADATLALDVLLDGGRIHIRRHGLLVLSRHALARIDERALGDAQVRDWCAAAMPLAVGLALSWPEGDALCPFGPGALLGTVVGSPTLEDGAALGPDGPEPVPVVPVGRAFVGRSWVPETFLVPAQAHLLRRLRRWSRTEGADALSEICSPLRMAPNATLQALARTRAWRRCPRPA